MQRQRRRESEVQKVEEEVCDRGQAMGIERKKERRNIRDETREAHEWEHPYRRRWTPAVLFLMDHSHSMN